MEAKSLFMLPWYPRDFMSSTRGWPLVARGAYRELLDAQWDMGTLPVDPTELRALAGATEAEWAIAWPRVESKFPLNCNGRKNQKLERVRTDAESYAQRKADAGRKGGLASASKRQAVLEQPLSDAQANVKHPSPSPSPSESPNKQKETAAPLVLHGSLPLGLWTEWLAHRREKRWPCDARTLGKQLKLLAKYSTEAQGDMIETAINAGWQGLFPPKGTQKPKTDTYANAI